MSVYTRLWFMTSGSQWLILSGWTGAQQPDSVVFGAAAGQAAALLPEFSLPILYSFVSLLIIVPQRVVMATGIFADPQGWLLSLR